MPRRYEAGEGYMPLAQAAERLRISRTKAWQWARDGVLPVYDDPRDRRVKLVRAEDVERLMQPRRRGEG